MNVWVTSSQWHPRIFLILGLPSRLHFTVGQFFEWISSRSVHLQMILKTISDFLAIGNIIKAYQEIENMQAVNTA